MLGVLTTHSDPMLDAAARTCMQTLTIGMRLSTAAGHSSNSMGGRTATCGSVAFHCRVCHTLNDRSTLVGGIQLAGVLRCLQLVLGQLICFLKDVAILCVVLPCKCMVTCSCIHVLILQCRFMCTKEVERLTSFNSISIFKKASGLIWVINTWHQLSRFWIK